MGRSLPSVALNQVNAITKTKGAGAVAQDPSGALKSRISKMEDEVDDLRTRTNTLVHDVMG